MSSDVWLWFVQVSFTPVGAVDIVASARHHMSTTFCQITSSIEHTFATRSSMSTLLFFTPPLKLVCSFNKIYPFPFFTDVDPPPTHHPS